MDYCQANKLKKQKGAIALLLSILIMSILLVISLAIANLAIKQFQLSRQARESVGAYQSADTGIEYGLYAVNKLDGDTRQGFYDAISETGIDNDEEFCSGSTPVWIEINATYGSYFCLDPVFDGGGSGNNIIGMKATGEFMNRTRRNIEVIPR